MMAVTVKIPQDLARSLNTLADENLYPSQEAALKRCNPVPCSHERKTV